MRKNKINNTGIKQILVFAAIVAFALSINSCANQGVGPSGGPRDTIAPALLNSTPKAFETNFEDNEIQLFFDEFVVNDNLNGKLVVSPPLTERVTIRTKGKGIVVKFNEELTPNRTYSVDFKDGIKDLNEGNALESYRILFSNYDKIDTLRIDGYLLDAYTLEPVEDAMATLYSTNNDTLFNTTKPDFIAKADENGYFLFDNLPEGSYKLFGIVDGDNNLFFSQETEQIGFNDSILSPSVEYFEQTDTIIKENDTIISEGYYVYYPDHQYNLLFLQEYFTQYMSSFERYERDKIRLTFEESLSDSFYVELVNHKFEEWSYTEFSENRDTVNIWITDPFISEIDSLYLKIDYTALDTAQNFSTFIDTLSMFFIPKEEKKSKKEEDIDKVELFNFKSNVTSSNFDLFKPILITSPLPVENLVDSLIRLEEVVNDSTFESINFTMEALPNSKRKFKINYAPKEQTRYQLLIDSATVVSTSGVLNNGFKSVFKTQKTDFYGTAIFNIEGFSSNGILQLLKNNKNEDVIKEQKVFPEDKTITLSYLNPGEYRVKLIADDNKNGKWDTGNIETHQLPEKVFYFSKVITIKSNWDLKETWTIDYNTVQLKELSDKKDEE